MKNRNILHRRVCEMYQSVSDIVEERRCPNITGGSRKIKAKKLSRIRISSIWNHNVRAAHGQ